MRTHRSYLHRFWTDSHAQVQSFSPENVFTWIWYTLVNVNLSGCTHISLSVYSPSYYFCLVWESWRPSQFLRSPEPQEYLSLWCSGAFLTLYTYRQPGIFQQGTGPRGVLIDTCWSSPQRCEKKGVKDNETGVCVCVQSKTSDENEFRCLFGPLLDPDFLGRDPLNNLLSRGRGPLLWCSIYI